MCLYVQHRVRHSLNNNIPLPFSSDQTLTSSALFGWSESLNNWCTCREYCMCNVYLYIRISVKPIVTTFRSPLFSPHYLFYGIGLKIKVVVVVPFVFLLALLWFIQPDFILHPLPLSEYGHPHWCASIRSALSSWKWPCFQYTPDNPKGDDANCSLPISCLICLFYLQLLSRDANSLLFIVSWSCTLQIRYICTVPSNRALFVAAGRRIRIKSRPWNLNERKWHFPCCAIFQVAWWDRNCSSGERQSGTGSGWWKMMMDDWLILAALRERLTHLICPWFQANSVIQVITPNKYASFSTSRYGRDTRSYHRMEHARRKPETDFCLNSK